MKSTKLSKKNSASKASKKSSATTKRATKKSLGKLHKKVREAIQILGDIGLPEGQVNERTAYTILALFEMTKNKSWHDANQPKLGVTQIMKYAEAWFQKKYAPNTREAIRKQSLHQLVQAGLVAQNPDDSARAINSQYNAYQATDAFLQLVRTFGTRYWSTRVKEFSGVHGTLTDKIKAERTVPRFEVGLPSGATVFLSAGGQNPLVKQVIEEFCSRFVKKPDVLYIGDAHKKNAFADLKRLARLGITLDEHGKAPDLIVYDKERKWLLLIEAVTSHGPMNIKRKDDLRHIFKNSKAPLVFVTAFEGKKTFIKYAQEIAWETEVWIADNPTHMIHYNGDKFLGPYEPKSTKK